MGKRNEQSKNVIWTHGKDAKNGNGQRSYTTCTNIYINLQTENEDYKTQTNEITIKRT